MKKAKKILACLLTVATVSIGVFGITANAATYNISFEESSGGFGGKTEVGNYVYKFSRYIPGSGVTLYDYGVAGYITKTNQVTNWTGGGTLHKTSSSKTISASSKSTRSFQVQHTLEGSSSQYVAYSLYMNTESTAYGKTSYSRNGAF